MPTIWTTVSMMTGAGNIHKKNPTKLEGDLKLILH